MTSRRRTRAKPPGRNETLVAADDGAVLATCQHVLDETVLLDAASQSFQLGVADFQLVVVVTDAHPITSADFTL